MGDRYSDAGLRAHIRLVRGGRGDPWDKWVVEVTCRGEPKPIISWPYESDREAQEKIDDALFAAYETLFGKRAPDAT